ACGTEATAVRDETPSHEGRHGEPSRESVTRKRHQTTPFRDASTRRLFRDAFRDAVVYLAATACPLVAGPFGGARSGFPGSVCTLRPGSADGGLPGVGRSAR